MLKEWEIQGIGMTYIDPLPEDDLHSLWKTIFLSAHPYERETLSNMIRSSTTWWKPALKFWYEINATYPITSFCFQRAQMASVNQEDYEEYLDILYEFCK